MPQSLGELRHRHKDLAVLPQGPYGGAKPVVARVLRQAHGFRTPFNPTLSSDSSGQPASSRLEMGAIICVLDAAGCGFRSYVFHIMIHLWRLFPAPPVRTPSCPQPRSLPRDSTPIIVRLEEDGLAKYSRRSANKN
ncbi:unnamed protein product [Nezara viridula]|uniref:Uncharacterized protein n=1 Tax=Nezara viridula TaxID=85310 RepID=A0A9P0EDJ7_NEZVI|nr:unnamed protein product [Nezara viridula]